MLNACGFKLAEQLKKKGRSILSKRGVLYLIFSFLILFSFYKHIGNAFCYQTEQPYDGGVVNLENEAEYVQELGSFSDPIRKIEIKFGTYERINEGLLKVCLRSETKIFQSWEIDIQSLKDNAYQTLEMPRPICLTPDESCYLTIQAFYEGENENKIAVFKSQSGKGFRKGTGELDDGCACYILTMESQSQKKAYMPVYMGIAVFLLLLCMFFIDFEHYSLFRGVVLCLSLMLLFKTIDYDLFQNFQTRAEHVISRQSLEEKTILPGESESFVFSAEEDFNRLKFSLNANEGKVVHVRLQNNDDGQICFDEVMESKTQGTAMFRLQSDGMLPAGSYSLTLGNAGEWGFFAEDEINIVRYKTVFLAHKLAMIVMFALVLFFIFFVFRGINQTDFAKQFLFILIPLSLVYFLLFLPWSQPDSGTHFRAIYRLSNYMMGYGEEEEWQGREEDVLFFQDFWGRDCTINAYSDVADQFHLRCQKPDMMEFQSRFEYMEYYSAVNYLPEILGISLGRWLNLSTVMTICLGRLFILLTYIIAAYHAVKKVPMGKGIFAMTALFPMSLMMSSAFSYDPMVLVSTLNFIGSILYLYKNSESKSGWAEAMIWAFVIGAVKGGGYLILLPLVFLLFDKKNRKKSGLKISCIVLSGLFSILLFDVILPSGMGFFQFGTEESVNLSVSYLWKEPLGFLDMLLKSYLSGMDNLVVGIAGSLLGWLEFTVPFSVSALLMVLGGIYSVFEPDEIALEASHKNIMIAVVVIAITVTPAMLLSATPVGSEWIGGIQARYFLPVVPILFFVLTKFMLRHPLQEEGAAIRKKVAVWFGAVSCLAVYYIVRLYLTR